MGTAERYRSPEGDAGARVVERPDTGTPNRGEPSAGRGAAGARDLPATGTDRVPAGATGTPPAGTTGGNDRVRTEAPRRPNHRPLWAEEPARRRRLPDPVRTSAVRAVIIVAITLIQAMVAFLCTLAGSWLAFPMVISSVVSTILATWGVLDVWVTRQVWNQRNGVVSAPSSTARGLRRERRHARRQERSAQRAQARIRRQGGGTGQLSHP
ncbi:MULTISPECIES: hypothetical protein [unclassified Streptomyces]|uniref:hypothetical protein n=1 Tax=unclassified Streptomyces TaxID=2593676 RepID=UPI0005A83BE5|nr:MULTISPECIES: hypothetical protein [unclassified Streptomyces]ODA71895.1 hypothetical protein APS67_003991 [Streptomyces sp. AVP053U2]